MSVRLAELPITQNVSCSIPIAGRQLAGSLWSNLDDVCNLLNISRGFAAVSSAIVFQHIQFNAGQRLFTIGQSFEMLYIVNSGFLKTVLIDDVGNEQILSFPMKGDVLGVDGIHAKQHMSEVVALSNCVVIAVPFKVFTSLCRKYPELEMSLYSVLSQELMREQAMAGMLRSLSAEARIARFLVNISERFSAMGYSGKEFNLRMTREEIGSYLGLTLETVSRAFSAFVRMGYISAEQKSIVLKDAKALKALRRVPPSETRAKRVKAKVNPIDSSSAELGNLLRS